jgi:hypothetical protein
LGNLEGVAMKTGERHWKERALVRDLGMGASLTAACAAVGIERSTFAEWVAEDATFAEEVRTSRVEALEGIMWSLRLLATGQLVEEEKVVETSRGMRREMRKRWVCGKVSACLALIRMVEADLAKPAAAKAKAEVKEEEKPTHPVILFEGEEDDDPTHGAEFDEDGCRIHRIIFRRDWTGMSEERIAAEKQWDLDRIAAKRKEREEARLAAEAAAQGQMSNDQGK